MEVDASPMDAIRSYPRSPLNQPAFAHHNERTAYHGERDPRILQDLRAPSGEVDRINLLGLLIVLAKYKLLMFAPSWAALSRFSVRYPAEG